MKPFDLEDIESVAYVDKDRNDVIIKFVGFPNELASQLFINYVMFCIGFNMKYNNVHAHISSNHNVTPHCIKNRS